MKVFAYKDENNECMLRREGRHRIIITTQNEIDDDMMMDLYWVVTYMAKTGLRLKDLMDGAKESEKG